MSAWTLGFGREVPLQRQSEAAECGLACLAMVMGYHGRSLSIKELRKKEGIGLAGMTLAQILSCASRNGLTGRPVKLPLDALKKIRTPAILHWNLDHFVVLIKCTSRNVVIHDPALGRKTLKWSEVSESFTGIALELEPGVDFEKVERRERLSFLRLLGPVRGLSGSLAQAMLLSLIVQAFVLASPFFLQLAVDEVVPTADIDLLVVLAGAFAIFALINVASTLVRSYVLIHLGNQLSYRMESNVFQHMLKLPVEYFERRHLGDIMSRFLSMNIIRDAINEGIVAGVIDGIMAVTTIVLMFIYSPLLAFISLFSWSLFLSVRLITYHFYHEQHENLILGNASVQSLFLETAKGITSLKVLGGENARSQSFLNKNAAAINENIRLESYHAWYGVVEELIRSLDRIIIIYLLISFVLAGDGFTLGMVFAFMAYKRSFVINANDLVTRIIQFKQMGLHLERVSDIVLSDIEEDTKPSISLRKDFVPKGQLSASNLTFAYSIEAPLVLDNLSVKFESGESVALVGPSGCGKTTLLKVLAGLIKPVTGEVLADGVAIRKMGLDAYRSQIGVVLQDDTLFAGSIAENIAFFNESADLEDVIAAAQAAHIHEDILKMPMGYQSMVGDMGSAFSGGQKQRMLLARAIYKNPKILFLDEGTSHLDVENERKVNASISELGITRILVAHRPETIASADRVIVLDGGKIVSDTHELN